MHFVFMEEKNVFTASDALHVVNFQLFFFITCLKLAFNVKRNKDVTQCNVGLQQMQRSSFDDHNDRNVTKCANATTKYKSTKM